MVIDRRTLLSSFLGTALVPGLGNHARSEEKRLSSASSSEKQAEEIRLYTYKNSLWDHAPGYGARKWGDNDTSASNWVGRIVAHARSGDSFRENSEFGFVTQWCTPPLVESANVHTAELDGYLRSSWKNMGQVNRLMFVPDDFNGWTGDPDALVNISPNESYQDALVRFIDAWEKNAPCVNGERTYLIYSGWPPLGEKEPQDYPYGPSDLAAWRTVGLGDFQNWYDLLTARVQAERPAVKVAQVPMNRVIVKTYLDTVLNTLPVARMFEDMAHGRETWYCLVGAIFYMSVFGKKVPADYVPPSDTEVDPVLVENWVAITDFAWNEIGGTAIVVD